MQRRVQKKKKVVQKRRVIGLEDMILLADTKDSGICENLKDRLMSSQIYTFIGHVSVKCPDVQHFNRILKINLLLCVVCSVVMCIGIGSV